MPRRDIIVLGTSAGGVTALQELLAELPKSFPASVFAVVHISKGSSSLPAILGRAANMPVVNAEHGQKFERGRIYLAPPDFHLRVQNGATQLFRGPKENHHRPAIDPLFCSAAMHYGARVVGVILTGSLDDGTQGLAMVKRLGGIAVVQNPEEAFAPSMPLSAVRNVQVDHVLRLKDMPAVLERLVAEEVRIGPAATREKTAVEVSKMNTTLEEMKEKLGPPAGFICPDCSGPLWETKIERALHYQCLVGHAYSPESLLSGGHEMVERALWTAVTALEERAALFDRLAQSAEDKSASSAEERFRERAKEHREHAEVLRAILAQLF